MNNNINDVDETGEINKLLVDYIDVTTKNLYFLQGVLNNKEVLKDNSKLNMYYTNKCRKNKLKCELQKRGINL